MLETLITLLTAYLLGDFVLQTDAMIARKKETKILLLQVRIVALALLVRREIHRILGAIPSCMIVGTDTRFHFPKSLRFILSRTQLNRPMI
jgi:hypothetical protein